VNPSILKVALVNNYLAYKQHLLPTSCLTDIVQVTRNIVALHATDATSPYLSLWARVPDFQREALEDALYERRELIKILCMRVTLHAVPSDELPLFFQAFPQAFFERRTPPRFRGKLLLVRAGVCQEEEAEAEEEREEFLTNAGRIVYGGGGITPDVIVKQDKLSAYEYELL